MKRSISFTIVGQVLCVSFCCLLMYPLGMMLTKSVQGKGLQNYKRVFELVDILPNFITSVFVVLGTLIIVSIVTSLSAFAFSKINFPIKSFLYYLVLTGMMIPTSAILFPLFRIVKTLNLINTPFSLILPYATLNAAFNLMVLKNFFDALPNELMEAAIIDGASTFKMYVRIMVPISLPGMSIVLIQTFLSAWNELQMAMTFINNPAVQPISVVPLRFVQTAGSTFPIEVMYASLVICLAPIAVFYICAQKMLVKGMAQGAVKG